MAAPKGNRYGIGNTGGQPRIFEKKEDLEREVILYFEEASEKKFDLTVTGLALYLGFESRQSLFDYGLKDEFSYIIKRAKLAVENGYEHGLHTFKASGSMFALKNMGWKDKTEVETKDTTNPTGIIDLKNVTDEELRLIEGIISRQNQIGTE